MQDLPELSKTSERTSHANKASRVSMASVVGTDFFELDKRHYLIVTDYFSQSVASQLNNIQLCYHSPKSCFRTSWDSNKLSEMTVVHSMGPRNRQYICDYGLLKLYQNYRVLQNNFSVYVMGCPCHILHNTAAKTGLAFEKKNCMPYKML